MPVAPPRPTRTRRPVRPTGHDAGPATPSAASVDTRRDAPAARRSYDLTALHGLRILLTTWLVVHHLVRWLLRDTGIDPDTVALLRQGQGATTGFFILSGVVLTTSWAARFRADPSLALAGTFLRRRWAAVWPLGAIGALVAVPYELVEDRLATGEFIVGLVANLALVQSWFPVGGGIHGMTLRFDGPTWTLSTLLVLYAMFPAIVLLVDRIRTKAGLVLLALVPWLLTYGTAWALVDEPKAVWMLHVHPMVRLADFLVGIAIGTWLIRHGAPRVGTARALQVVGLAGLVATVWCCAAFDLPREVRFGAMFIPAFAVLVSGLTVHAGVIGAVLRTRPLQYAGKRAFAVAMLHTPIMGLAWHAGILRLDQPLGIAAVLATSALLAATVHRWIEMPLRTKLRLSRAEHAERAERARRTAAAVQ